LTGVFYCCRAVARSMVSRGSGGRIVITSSVAGKRAERFLAAYSASKFGVIGTPGALREWHDR